MHTPATGSWQVRTQDGLTVFVPDHISSLTTFVMLEQERWFESEVGFVQRLLTPDMHALDVGANHGVYSLALARHLTGGHVWAFEPTVEPRSRLMQSVLANGFEQRLTVVPLGLSDRARSATFHTSANSELNSLHASGTSSETVALEALDDYLAQHLPGQRIDFVKLDAEGEEPQVLTGGCRFFDAQSPIVMFELQHGGSIHLPLIEAFRSHGFDVFRHHPELELLVAFDDRAEELQFVLNLFAIKPDRQAALAAQNLLVRAGDLAAASDRAPASQPAALVALMALPWAVADAALDHGRTLEPAWLDALARVATVHLGAGISATDRVLLMVSVRDQLQRDLDSGALVRPEAWLLLVHCLYALGQQHSAVAMARKLLAMWPNSHPSPSIAMPARVADLARPRSVDLGSWLRLTLAEFVETRRAFSSYFAPANLDTLRRLLDHPDHSAEMERRYVLHQIRSDATPDAARVPHLADPLRTANPTLWRGVLASFGQAGAPALDVLDWLIALQTGPLRLVDVGASNHAGKEADPCASLLRKGAAHITGFEPDDTARMELGTLHPDPNTHRFLPHFVGAGGSAVFHETNWFMTGSLLEPNREVLDHYPRMAELTQLVARHPVQTVRLDDAIEPGGMDMLKIDVQGAEGAVFSGATERLSEALLVWSEVEFVPLYRDQPLFGDIDRQLRAAGLQFHSFAGFGTRSLASWPQQLGQPRRQQMLWADAVFVPNPQRIATLDDSALRKLSLLAHEVLGAVDIAHRALLELDRRDAGDLAARYLALVRPGVTSGG